MRYARLTKEQLEGMHEEFSKFLATQSIDAKEWSEIKEQKPEVAEQEIDVFSDLVWEGVLGKVKYLEHFSSNQIHLFHLLEDKMELIAVRVKNLEIDLLTNEGYQWLQENLMNESVEFFSASKDYNDDKNLDKFTLIQQGAQITKGELYGYFENLVKNN